MDFDLNLACKDFLVDALMELGVNYDYAVIKAADLADDLTATVLSNMPSTNVRGEVEAALVAYGVCRGSDLSALARKVDVNSAKDAINKNTSDSLAEAKEDIKKSCTSVETVLKDSISTSSSDIKSLIQDQANGVKTAVSTSESNVVKLVKEEAKSLSDGVSSAKDATVKQVTDSHASTQAVLSNKITGLSNDLVASLSELNLSLSAAIREVRTGLKEDFERDLATTQGMATVVSESQNAKYLERLQSWSALITSRIEDWWDVASQVAKDQLTSNVMVNQITEEVRQINELISQVESLGEAARTWYQMIDQTATIKAALNELSEYIRLLFKQKNYIDSINTAANVANAASNVVKTIDDTTNKKQRVW